MDQTLAKYSTIADMATSGAGEEYMELPDRRSDGGIASLGFFVHGGGVIQPAA